MNRRIAIVSPHTDRVKSVVIEHAVRILRPSGSGRHEVDEKLACSSVNCETGSWNRFHYQVVLPRTPNPMRRRQGFGARFYMQPGCSWARANSSRARATTSSRFSAAGMASWGALEQLSHHSEAGTARGKVDSDGPSCYPSGL